MAASCDGISVVVKPGKAKTDTNSRFIIASQEIKTKVSPVLMRDARRIAQTHGKYFECILGSAIWFETVPEQYRGQMMQQAVVTNLDYGLLTMGTTNSICYSVLVYFPPDSRESWGTRVNDVWKRTCEWLFEAETLQSISLPEWFDETDDDLVEILQITKSRFPMWHAARLKFRANRGPLPPIAKVRALVQ